MGALVVDADDGAGGPRILGLELLAVVEGGGLETGAGEPPAAEEGVAAPAGVERGGGVPGGEVAPGAAPAGGESGGGVSFSTKTGVSSRFPESAAG